jgi:PhoD-like phosphatase
LVECLLFLLFFSLLWVDIHGPKNWSTFPPSSNPICATPARLRHLYNKQLKNKAYRQLINQNITIFGTIDGTFITLVSTNLVFMKPVLIGFLLYHTKNAIDHDYGCNNADETFQFKHESSLAFVDFINQPDQSPMRLRASQGHGVYGVKLFDFSRPDGQVEVPDHEAGIDSDLPVLDHMHPTYSNRSVAVFVLDVRSYKTPWKSSPQSYIPDIHGDFLGERQWEWFEQSIRRSQAAVNVIVSGLQFHGNRFPDANIAEAWGKFPTAQQRLFDTILQDSVHAPILISGDVHMTQLARKDCIRQGDYTTKRPLVELTTSGMTHSWGTIATPISRIAGGPTWTELYASFIGRYTMHLLHYVCPWTELMIAQDFTQNDDNAALMENGGGEGAKDGIQYSLEMNFGELEIDWTVGTVAIRAIGEGIENPPLLMAKMSIEQLSGRSTIPGKTPSMFEFTKESQSQRVSGEWVCVNHRGAENPMENFFGQITSSAIMNAPSTVIPFIVLGIVLLALGKRIKEKQLSSNQNGTRIIEHRIMRLSDFYCYFSAKV